MDLTRTLTVPGTPDGVREAIAALEAWVGDERVAPQIRRGVLTAVDEVLSNVVRHGFRTGTGEMTMTVRASNAALTVEVADTAPAFNPLLVPAPDVHLPLERRRPGGLGVALVRALSDEVVYAFTLNRNVLTLSWRLDAPPTRGAHGHS